jgi:hypothetical protein
MKLKFCLFLIAISITCYSCKKENLAKDDPKTQNPDPASPDPEDVRSGQLKTIGKNYFYKEHVAVDDQQNIYTTGLTTGGNKLIKVNTSGDTVKSYSAADFGLDAGIVPYVVGVCNDAKGTVWTLVLVANRPVKLFRITSGAEKPILDREIDNNQSLVRTTALRDMEVTSGGDVYFIAEYQNYVVRKIDQSGTESYFISAMNGVNPFNPSKTVAVTDLTLDADNNLYVSAVSSLNDFFGVYKYTPDKVVTEIMRSENTGYLDGKVTEAKFDNFQNILVDAQGKLLYIGDKYRLRKLDLQSNTVSTVAGNGEGTAITYSYSGEGLKGKCMPSKLTFNKDQTAIYINSHGVLEQFVP